MKRTCFFRANIDANDFRRFNSTGKTGMPENVVLTRYDLGYRNIVREFLTGFFAGQDKRVLAGKNPYVVEVSIKIIGDSRTLDQNALLWKLYTIIADILNHDDPRANETPSRLYEADMLDYAPVNPVDCPTRLISACIQLAESGEDEVKGHLFRDIDHGDGNHTLLFQETTSFWDTVRLADLITAKIADIEEMGRTRHDDGYVKSIIDDFHAMQKKENKK